MLTISVDTHYQTVPSVVRQEPRDETVLTLSISLFHIAQFTMVQIQVNEGLLEGFLQENDYGDTFYSFKGIPYATPPIGELRFKAPQAPTPWEGVRSAKEFGPKCFQFDTFKKSGTIGSEDCLYLNVYTPDVAPSKPLPVIVWIHGGAFMSGSGNDDLYGPEFLVRQRIILVTVNYRLEVLGFLCLDTEDVPGNAGLKDQVQALRWVQKNITNFGGDPNNVTLAGVSAGGSSVSYHLISPMSKGLFARAIQQSGSSNSPWSQNYKPRERAFALGRNLGLYTDNVNELYNFLKTQPVESLIQAQVPLSLSEQAQPDLKIYFSITDEKLFGENERFFYGDVYDILRQGIRNEVDVMTGFTSDEGIVYLGTREGLDKKIDAAENYLEYLSPQSMKSKLPIEELLEVGRKIKKYYFKNEKITAEDWEGFVKFYSMNMFVYPLIEWVKFHAKKQRNNIYVYKFTCKTERNVLSHMLGSSEIIGDKPVTSHGDDVMYLFNARLVKKVSSTSRTFEIIDRVTKLWTNFAKYGNPTPNDDLNVRWTPYTLEKQDYLDIGNDLLPATKPEQQEIEFWESIYKQYLPHQVFN